MLPRHLAEPLSPSQLGLWAPARRTARILGQLRWSPPVMPSPSLPQVLLPAGPLLPGPAAAGRPAHHPGPLLPRAPAHGGLLCVCPGRSHLTCVCSGRPGPARQTLTLLSLYNPGLLLGSCLILLVSAVSEEFSSVEADDEEGEYNYSWSFLLAILAFLGCNVSSLLAFSGETPEDKVLPEYHQSSLEILLGTHELFHSP